MKSSLIFVSLLVAILMVGFFAAPALAQDPVSGFESPVIPGEEETPGGLGAIDWQEFFDRLFSGDAPGSMVQAVELVAAMLAGLFGLGNLTQAITNALKKINWGWLTLGQKEKLGGEIAEVAAYLVAVGLTYVTTQWLLPLADRVDNLGIWGIALAVWAFARTVYFSRKKNT
jgi:hypothetical protein